MRLTFDIGLLEQTVCALEYLQLYMHIHYC